MEQSRGERRYSVKKERAQSILDRPLDVHGKPELVGNRGAAEEEMKLDEKQAQPVVTWCLLQLRVQNQSSLEQQACVYAPHGQTCEAVILGAEARELQNGHSNDHGQIEPGVFVEKRDRGNEILVVTDVLVCPRRFRDNVLQTVPTRERGQLGAESTLIWLRLILAVHYRRVARESLGTCRQEISQLGGKRPEDELLWFVGFLALSVMYQIPKMQQNSPRPEVWAQSVPSMSWPPRNSSRQRRP